MIITKISKIGDPQIILYEGKYYCYATISDHYSDGFSVWVSDDLVNWSEPIHCFNAKDYWGESHFWAPEVIYHNGKFVMHYTARSSELKSLRLGVAVSDSPTGPFVDVHNRPMFDFGYAAIDGSILISKEGNYLYYSRDCSENVINGDHTSQIYCVEVNDDLTEVIGEAKLMTTPELPFELKSKTPKDPWLWNEGPFVIYRNGEYIMNYSANCYATNDYAICVATSKHPLGPWVKSKNNPVLSCHEELFGSGHNALFVGKDNELYTSFHIQTDPKHPSGDRTVVIGKVKFDVKDNEIYQTIE